MEGRTFYSKWDCTHCGNKGIRGDIKTCPSCGNPVGSGVKYYLDTNDLVEVSPSANISKNPHWRCDYCGSYNSDHDMSCRNCGGIRTLETKNYFTQDEKPKPKAEPQSQSSYYSSSVGSLHSDVDDNDSDDYDYDYDYTPSPRPSYSSSYSSAEGRTETIWEKIIETIKANPIIVSGVVISILLIIAGCLLFIPKERDLLVDGVSWERSYDIAQYKTVREDDWDLPSNARLAYTRKEIHHYEQVFDHYETEHYTERVFDHNERYVSGYRDNGNGTHSEVYSTRAVYRTEYKTRQVAKYRSEPVKKTKYYYDIDKFVYDHTNTAQGADKDPHWPEEPKEWSGDPKIGDERITDKHEKYFVAGRIIGEKENHDLKEYTINYDEWLTVNPGDTIRVKIYINKEIELVFDTEEE